MLRAATDCDEIWGSESKSFLDEWPDMSRLWLLAADAAKPGLLALLLP